jgi:hypothetical protein
VLKSPVELAAKKLLGHSPKWIAQIGRVNVDVSGSKRHSQSHVDGQEFHVMDMNDTDEGAVVSSS